MSQEESEINIQLYELARNINITYNEVLEEKRMSKSGKRLKNIVEVKLWFMDASLLIFLVYFTFFDKPYWCAQKRAFINNNCTEDIYGNNYNLIRLFEWGQSPNFFLAVLIMIYFNIKSYLVCWNLEGSVKLVHSRRRLKLVLLTSINIAHLLFFFLERDGVMTYNMCNLFRSLFLLIVVDFSFEVLIKIMNNILSHMDVFLFFIGIIAIQGGVANVIFHSFDDYFDSYYFYTFKFSHFFACFYSMFIYMTRDNSPFVFMKYYPDNYIVNISFMVVIWFFNLILIGLLTGIAYYKLKRQMAKELLKVYSDQNKLKTFEKLKNTPKVKKSMLKRVLTLHLENKIVPYLLINTYIQEKKTMKPIDTKASQYIFGVLKKMAVYEFIFSGILIIPSFEWDNCSLGSLCD